MTLTLYMSKRFENTKMGLRIGTVLGVSLHLLCLVVYLNDNLIKIAVNCHQLIYSDKQSKKKSMTGKFPSFYKETIGAMLSLCLTVYNYTNIAFDFILFEVFSIYN